MPAFRVYAQLVRLPNVFTALADIGLAGLASGALTPDAPPAVWQKFCFLLLSSACLYCGGMVWNDIFDLEQDKQERPFRPLPSGKVPRARAIRFGMLLLALGIIFASLAGWDGNRMRWTAPVLAGILAAIILLYDGVLKRTWLGPVGMGTCRFLNVLLGLSIGGWPFSSWGIGLALAVGVYIAGVTWFARTEALTSNREMLTWAALVMMAGLLLALPLPVLAEKRLAPVTTSFLFPYLLVGFGFGLGMPISKAIQQPSPGRVQTAVKMAVLGLVVFDAILATALVGIWGLVLLGLLPPALYLGRWFYST
jgi:4-hydroxybenzoate polyprenyltransferase